VTPGLARHHGAVRRRGPRHTAIESGDDIGTLGDTAFGMLEQGLPTTPKRRQRKRVAPA